MFSNSASQVSDRLYVDDVFSTYLYTGNGTSQTVNNGIDLAGKGGLVWIKARSGSNSAEAHRLYDTAQGAQRYLSSNTTSGTTQEASGPTTIGLSIFGPSGFFTQAAPAVNGSATDYVSWTFRKAPKFFDVVTYTGDGTNNRQIAHSLGSVPGCIIAKCTSTTQGWDVWHRAFSDTTQNYLQLDSTAAVASFPNVWGTQSATTFTVGSGGSNINGRTYVAYLFAHDAGGFGLTGTDNVITCGSFTADGSGNATITGLGYEPQWVLIKPTDFVNAWYIEDSMRGWSLSGPKYLVANTAGAEVAGSSFSNPTANGFTFNYGTGANNKTFIYIAIRRPHKPPTSGTSVYAPVALASPSAVPTTIARNTGFPVDTYFAAVRNQGFSKMLVGTRLQGPTGTTVTAGVDAELTGFATVGWDSNTSVTITDNNGSWNGSSASDTNILYAFRRAPNFYDVVCYRGTGAAQTVAHNLGVAPELIISKRRDAGGSSWIIYAAPRGASSSFDFSSNPPESGTSTAWNNTAPTAAAFSVNNYANNVAGSSNIAYLFASCPGISKVGSYTGNGTSQTIDCGFATGARFILIKRTDNTGDWYVWDSARGIIAANDPRLSLNSTNPEVTTDDSVDPDVTGFVVNQVAATNINVTGGTYIFLAIA